MVRFYGCRLLANLLRRVNRFLKRRCNKKKYGRIYLLFALITERLGHLIQFLDPLEQNVPSLPRLPKDSFFQSKLEYRQIYAPEKTLSIPVENNQIVNAASHSLRRFLSYKHSSLTNESGCAVYRNPVLNPKHGVFADSSYQLIRGVWNETHHDDHFLAAKMLTEKDITNAQRLNGVYASLLGPWSQNYYHWLIQYLPRLHLVAKHLPLSNVDGFLVPSPLLPFQLESLAYFGIDSSRVIPVKGPICPDECIITTIPCENRFVPGWVVNFFQAHASKALGAGPKKIFVMRGPASRRQIVNQSQVIKLLLDHEIQPVDPGGLAFADQVSLFATSQLICGVHGAALANLVFCRKGSHVVELIPANYPYHCFARLSTALSLDYYGLFGVEPSSRLMKTMLQDADTIIDVDKLNMLLCRLNSLI